MKKTLFLLGYIIVVYVLLDFVILKMFFPVSNPSPYEIYGQVKKPYVMFTGKEGVFNQNEEGFISPSLKDLRDSSGIKIAFFGGSTGYMGIPTIPQTIERLLEETLDTVVYVSNYSHISGNHLQHLHYYVEYLLDLKTDLVIFYGGFNETQGTAFHDPRPGYPHDYFFNYDLPAWKQWLVRRSTLVGHLERHQLRISGLPELREEVGLYTDEWSEAIVDHYLSCMNKADLLARSTRKENNRFSSPFMGFYQPYQVNADMLLTQERILDSLRHYDHFYDLSQALGTLNDSVYTDVVHLQQYGRDHMARLIAEIIINQYIDPNGAILREEESSASH